MKKTIEEENTKLTEELANLRKESAYYKHLLLSLLASTAGVGRYVRVLPGHYDMAVKGDLKLYLDADPVSQVRNLMVKFTWE